jgi:hypothetical protein
VICSEKPKGLARWSLEIIGGGRPAKRIVILGPKDDGTDFLSSMAAAQPAG